MDWIRIKSASDADIIDACAGEVTNRKDLILNEKSEITAIGGLYDSNVFGFLYKCPCSQHYHKPGKCPSCNNLVVNDETGSERYGYYVLSMPIIHEHKLTAFFKELGRVLPELNSYYHKKATERGTFSIWNHKIAPVQVSDIAEDNSENPHSYVRDENGDLFRLDIDEYSKEDSISNFKYYGPKGLYNIFKNYKPLNNDFSNLITKINQVVPIAPAVHRRYSKINGRYKFPELTVMYGMIIDLDQNISNKFDLDPDLTLADKLTLGYSMNKMITLSMKNYALVKTSKQSLIRYAVGGRVGHSGRATMVGDPELPIDTFGIPRSLAYEALKEELLKEYSKRYPKRLEMEDYKKPTKEMLDLFEEIGNNSVVMINRQPTLYRLGIVAGKCKLVDGSALRLPLLICIPINGDFDGDQSAIYFIVNDFLKAIVLDRMSPANNWYFERSYDPIYVPNTQILLGLNFATKLFQGSETKLYDTFNEIETDFKNQSLKYNEVIEYQGVKTSYGRAKVGEILGLPYDRIFTNEDRVINSSNIGNIISLMSGMPDRINKLNELQKFGLYIVTIHGNTTISVRDLYKFDPDIPEIKKIAEDPRMCDAEKYRKLYALLPSIIKKKIYELPDATVRNVLEGSGKVKLPQLVETLGPKISYKKGRLIVETESLATGMRESVIMRHAISNRNILNYKKSLTPLAGYLTREFVNIGYNEIFKKDKLSTDKLGILVPRCLARGRTTLEGELIPKDERSMEFVRIKSFLTSKSDWICNDEVALYKYNTSDNQPLGILLETALTEFLTQGSLQLKHGGDEIRPSDELLKFLIDIKVLEIHDNYILIKIDGQDKIYPLPKNALVTLEAKEGEVKKGEPVYYLNELMKLDYKLACFVYLVGSNNREHVETKIVPINCYSYWEGKIHYDFDSGSVFIGSNRLPLYRDQVYYYSEGDQIAFGTKICSGVLSIPALRKFVPDVGKCFYIFYDQLLRLADKPINLEPAEVLIKGILKSNNSTIQDTLIKNDDYIAKANFSRTNAALKENVDERLANSFITSLMINIGE